MDTVGAWSRVARRGMGVAHGVGYVGRIHPGRMARRRVRSRLVRSVPLVGHQYAQTQDARPLRAAADARFGDVAFCPQEH